MFYPLFIIGFFHYFALFLLSMHVFKGVRANNMIFCKLKTGYSACLSKQDRKHYICLFFI